MDASNTELPPPFFRRIELRITTLNKVMHPDPKVQALDSFVAEPFFSALAQKPQFYKLQEKRKVPRKAFILYLYKPSNRLVICVTKQK